MNRRQKRAAEKLATQNDKRRLQLANELVQQYLKKRDCGACDACCTLLEISELDKPAGKPCHNLSDAEEVVGCCNYDSRPEGCRNWNCSWRMGLGHKAERPDKIGLMFDVTRGAAKFPALVVRETREGAYEEPEAQEMLKRLVEEGNMMILMKDGGARRVYGPADKLAEIRQLAEMEKAHMEAEHIERLLENAAIKLDGEN